MLHEMRDTYYSWNPTKREQTENSLAGLCRSEIIPSLDLLRVEADPTTGSADLSSKHPPGFE